jgi:hypothetical protein
MRAGWDDARWIESVMKMNDTMTADGPSKSPWCLNIRARKGRDMGATDYMDVSVQVHALCGLGKSEKIRGLS